MGGSEMQHDKEAALAPAYTIDRFEGAVAVLEAEDGTFIQVPRHEIPADAAEGDRLRKLTEVTSGVGFAKLDEETAALRAEAEDRLRRLRSRDPGGDIEL